ncbi:hypothetical protein Trydic_g20433, partial [Trypoxylus dichotomus]
GSTGKGYSLPHYGIHQRHGINSLYFPALTTLKPNMWPRYVDDTFVMWSHGVERIDGFLEHLNSLQELIEFTEVQKDYPSGSLQVRTEEDRRLAQMGKTDKSH